MLGLHPYFNMKLKQDSKVVSSADLVDFLWG